MKYLGKILKHVAPKKKKKCKTTKYKYPRPVANPRPSIWFWIRYMPIRICKRNETPLAALEAMYNLICAPNPTLYISNFAPCKPKIPAFYKLNHPSSRIKSHANAKGFSGTPSTVGSEISSNKSKKNNEDDDDEIPQEVFNRIIVRILVSVGFPMGLGLAILQVIGVLKEQHIWDVPMWLPFLTTFLTFGASTLGIAYGTLSTSLDAERKGSFLGLEEVEKNWAEMWKEEDENKG